MSVPGIALDSLERKRRAAGAFIALGWPLVLLGPARIPLRNCPLCDEESGRYVPHTGVSDCPHPLDVCHGYKAGSRDPGHVIALLERHPSANLGLVNGLADFVTVDLDTNKRNAAVPDAYRQMPGLNDGWDVFAYILERYGAPWPRDALVVATPSGGCHLTYRLAPGTVITSSAGRFGWLIDIKAAGSYIPAPGTVVRTGVYRRCGEVTDPGPAPDWLMHHLKVTGHVPEPPRPRRPFRFQARPGRDRVGQERLGRIADQLATAPPQTGHAALCTATIAAAHLVADGLVEEYDAADTVFEAGRARGRTESEIRDAWRTALAKTGTRLGR